jgi:O-antigen ligase
MIMQGRHGTGPAPRAHDRPTVGRAHAWRASDFVLFLLVPFASIPVAGFPLSELAMAVAVVLAASRSSDPLARVPGWLPSLLALFFVWMCVVSLVLGLAPYRRLIHLVLFCFLIVLLASGKFAMRSVAAGLAIGLVASAGGGLMGLSNEGYAGRLTGFLGDPNVAGFYLIALGSVAAAHLPDRRGRWWFLAVIAVLVALTLSRTSLLALGLVAVWIGSRRRLSPLANIALISVLLYAISRSIDYLRLIGPFAERAGSDALRERIVALEQIQVAEHPWLGNGPGTSLVLVDGVPFFFHNSYLALQNEGGVLALAIVIGLGLLTLLLLARLPRSTRNLWLEAAVVGVATCAANLGEVLLELPTAIVLGAALLEISRSRGELGAAQGDATNGRGS